VIHEISGLREVKMEYQTIKENGKVKFVVLPIKSFQALLAQLEDKADLQAIREADSEPLYDQEEAESYIFMNPVKRERLDRGWTQQELASRLGVKQATVAKWERQGAVYRKRTREKLAKVFAVDEEVFF
jgi:ribosome-binding protein aMBF1 (putative translation factor)